MDVLVNKAILEDYANIEVWVYARFKSTGERVTALLTKRYNYYNDKKERIYGGVVGSQSYFIYYNANYSDKVGLYTIIDDVRYES